MSESTAEKALAPTAAATPDTGLRWYVVHAYSGMEKAVERNLKERIDRAGMQTKFGRILVPTEEVVELKNGKKAVTERRFFPGYVLVEMEMEDDTWHLVKHTSKVTGFVGGAKNRPAPISEAEVMKIVNQMQEGVEKPRPKVQWTVGELVRVKEGPFTDFLPFLSSTTSSIGTRMRPNFSFISERSMRSRRLRSTAFSMPEYACTTYQRLPAVGANDSGVTAASLVAVTRCAP